MTDYQEHIGHFMEKAARSEEAARDLLESHPEFYVSRAYYAMFYAAEAVLLTRGMQFKKHSAVIGAFNREFVKSGVFPKTYTRVLRKAYDFRMQGDYTIVPVEKEKAQAVLDNAIGFVETVRSFLKDQGFLWYD